jgi:hypothetical protein
VRISELDGVGPLWIPYSRQAAARVITWLDQAMPPPQASADPRAGAARSPVARAPRDARLGWSALGLLGALGLVGWLARALAPLCGPASGPVAAAAVTAPLGRWLAAGAAAALLMGAVSAPGLRAQLGVLALGGARDTLAYLALWGLAALALGLRPARGRAPAPAGTWVAAALVALCGYAVLGALLSAWVDAYPAPARLGPSALAALAALPHFAALEWGLRADGARWLPLAGRALAPALLGAAWWLGLVPRDAILCIPVLLLSAPLFELSAARLAACGASPWVAALSESLLLGWLLGALFPLLVA